MAPAHALTNLKALRCEVQWLLPPADDELFDNEALSQGFHSKGEVFNETLDPRNHLPASLEYLCLDGAFDNEEWKELCEVFESANENTPKLSLENTRLVRGTDVNFGRAMEAEQRFDRPYLSDIWRRHNHYL